jgi:hypothetical protein
MSEAKYRMEYNHAAKQCYVKVEMN